MPAKCWIKLEGVSPCGVVFTTLPSFVPVRMFCHLWSSNWFMKRALAFGKLFGFGMTFSIDPPNCWWIWHRSRRWGWMTCSFSLKILSWGPHCDANAHSWSFALCREKHYADKLTFEHHYICIQSKAMKEALLSHLGMLVLGGEREPSSQAGI